jgi:hypothetical protein
VDPEHGESQTDFYKMGSPPYPTRRQILELRAAAVLPPPRVEQISQNELTLSVPAHGLALIEVK